MRRCGPRGPEAGAAAEEGARARQHGVPECVLVYHTISKSKVLKLELDAEWCMSMLGVLSQLTRHYITPKVVPGGLHRVPGPHQEAVLQGVWPDAGQPADRAQCLQAAAVPR